MTQPAAAPVRTTAIVRASWRGDRRYETGKPDGPQALIDGDGVAAQSPPEALLSALATCSAVDVVDILAKRRTPVAALVVDVAGERRAENPRRFEHVVLHYRVDGKDIERIHAERAVSLSFERYCTVAASLGPDIVVETVVVLNGEEGGRIRQPIFTPTR
ncbi:MAG TPA: OsmC family protein [Gemmatimonadaceae bacterium]